MFKSFSKDHLVRTSSGKPLGRVIMSSNYKEGEDIQIALLEIPMVFVKAVKGYVLYIDGNPYRIPKELPDIRITKTGLKWVINTFVLEKL